MQQPIAIGVDLGGTKIAFAAVDRDGTLLATHTEQTLPDEGADAVIGRIASGVEKLSGQGVVAGIGIGAPGPVVDGVALRAVNLGWTDVPLVARLRERLTSDVPIFAQNDVNAGTVGEYIFGAGRGVRDFVYLAAGTGLAGGAVLDGQLMNGARGFAMEVGHISLDPHGRACGCGGHGCVEMYCSGKGLRAGLNAYVLDYPTSPLAALGAEARTRDILDAVKVGDPLALRLIGEAGDALGVVMAWSMIILAPDLLVIGGGLGNAAYDLLMAHALPTMSAHVPAVLKAPQIVRSQVQASALGAAALVWHGLASTP